MEKPYDKINGRAVSALAVGGNYFHLSHPDVAESGVYGAQPLSIALNSVPQCIPQQIHDLGEAGYSLAHPIQIVLNIHPDEVCADWPEVNLQGRGETEKEAMDNLKKEILDAYDDLMETPYEQLAGSMPAYKRILSGVIAKH